MRRLPCYTKILTFVLIFFFLFNACENTVADNAEEDIEDRWEDFIQFWELEDATALGDFYAEDAIHIMPNGQRNIGRERIVSFYQDLFDDNLSSKYKVTTDSLYKVRDTLIDIGSFEVNWVRNDSSEWKFAAVSEAKWLLSKDDDEWYINYFQFKVKEE